MSITNPKATVPEDNQVNVGRLNNVKLCGLLCGRHNVPPPPASGDLNIQPKLSDWTSPRMSVMQVIVLHLCTKF